MHFTLSLYIKIKNKNDRERGMEIQSFLFCVQLICKVMERQTYFVTFYILGSLIIFFFFV